MDPAATSLVILGVAVALFVWNRLPVGVVAVLTALALADGVRGPRRLAARWPRATLCSCTGRAVIPLVWPF
ncbi:hypothetical protein [Actinoplanes solisilvae]|uniref:hypothetical protein n=1 Tax=Actinoplanes solisilvae TaxID=2486853 RepID=UPI000FDC6A63|nr:hypothetical protein [Actinoplanes solisilvae]